MSDDKLISEDYRKQYEAVHHSNARYGKGAHRWAGIVRHLVREHGLRDVLDYGCGKQALKASLPELDVRGYDPAFSELAHRPEPADLLFCCDVLEHIEPEFLGSVLDELVRLTRSHGFILVSTRLANQILPDGRNAHVNVMSGPAWTRLIAERFDLVYMIDYQDEMRRKRDLKSRLVRWAIGDIRGAVPKPHEVIFLVRPKGTVRTGPPRGE